MLAVLRMKVGSRAFNFLSVSLLEPVMTFTRYDTMSYINVHSKADRT